MPVTKEYMVAYYSKRIAKLEKRLSMNLPQRAKTSINNSIERLKLQKWYTEDPVGYEIYLEGLHRKLKIAEQRYAELQEVLKAYQ